MASETIKSRTALFLFPRDTNLTGMLNWMGPDYPAALAAMLARGFQRQQPGTRLVSIKCLKRPELVTSLFTGTLNKRIRAIFVVEALLVDPQGNAWQLEIKATCTGRMLSRPEDGILASDVDVLKFERLVTTGQQYLEQLSYGVTCERRGLTIEWDAPLDRILTKGSPLIEVDKDTHYLSWQNEAILGGLEGMLFTSFSTRHPTLHYVSICPTSARFTGSVDDGLQPEWEHLTRLFGPPEEQSLGCGFRWVHGPLEFLLLYQDCNQQQAAEEYQKWVTIRRTANGKV